ncbi:MFS transporter [Salirhabdus sp. Marseille-P4669]|uniref:MFS transporter n=1 Tax=Salirhabdus sp. Marseille-P4669 TaxID=2042310 RepID=UPI001F2C3222|nr:MFS transporter [Salirhabdus sp. Marseille-P4669]
MEQNEKLWTLPFILLIVGNLFTFMSFQMLIPTLPPYMKDLGGTETQIGLVTALFSIGAILSRPYLGHLLEVKKRKGLVVTGSVLLLAITILYPLSQVIVLFLLMRFIHGLAWGWSTTVNGTAAVDLVPRNRIGEGMGYFGLAMTIGMVVAPSLGIFLFQTYSFQTMITVSVFLGIIAVLLFSVTTFSTPKSVEEMQQEKPTFSFLNSLYDKNCRFPIIVTFCNTFAYGSIVTFIVIFAEERALEGIFLFYLFNALMATIIRPLTGKWFDQKGPWPLILTCSLLAFLGMWMLVYAESNVMIAISGGVFGLGYGSMMPAFQAWVVSKTTVERSGIANGMFYSSIDLGIGLSAIVLSFIYKYTETATLFKLSSTLFLVVFVLTLLDYRKSLHIEKSPNS